MKILCIMTMLMFFSAGQGMAQIDSFPSIYEEEAEFPGGMDALRKFMRENICYPDSAKALGIEGKVYVGFAIDADGKVSDAVIKRGISPEFDTLVLQMMKIMPNWIPKRLEGRAIKSRYTLPVYFSLDKENKYAVTVTPCSEFKKKKKSKKK